MEDDLHRAKFEHDSSGNSEDDEAVLQSIMAVLQTLCNYVKDVRTFKKYNNSKRVNWNQHVELLVHRKEFENTYQMELTTFNLLVETLHDNITFDVAKARNSAPHMDPIYPELVCTVGL